MTKVNRIYNWYSIYYLSKPIINVFLNPYEELSGSLNTKLFFISFLACWIRKNPDPLPQWNPDPKHYPGGM
jgi:hypothetical protein